MAPSPCCWHTPAPCLSHLLVSSGVVPHTTAILAVPQVPVTTNISLAISIFPRFTTSETSQPLFNRHQFTVSIPDCRFPSAIGLQLLKIGPLPLSFDLRRFHTSAFLSCIVFPPLSSPRTTRCLSLGIPSAFTPPTPVSFADTVHRCQYLWP
jgi:hypothetical protein